MPLRKLIFISASMHLWFLSKYHMLNSASSRTNSFNLASFGDDPWNVPNPLAISQIPNIFCLYLQLKLLIKLFKKPL